MADLTFAVTRVLVYVCKRGADCVDMWQRVYHGLRVPGCSPAYVYVCVRVSAACIVTCAFDWLLYDSAQATNDTCQIE